MRAIITRGLYILNPLFEGQKRFSRTFFQKILPLCMISIQERVMMTRVRYIQIPKGFDPIVNTAGGKDP